MDIDLKKLFDENEIKTINELFLKRNVIVHNNGIADDIYVSQSANNCKIGELIPIFDEDVSRYLAIVASIVEKIEGEFEKIIYPEIDIRIDDF